uniref:J domain-containing protein n=1 Tax=viral metagenome TaxID=1070528 RepID=A0A6C0B265_9ZZZZ
MNYEKACKILDIDELTIDVLKKQYRFNALKYHPDKNSAVDAASKFQEIQSAYEYLLHYLECENSEDDNDDEGFSKSDKNSYKNMLFSFLNNIIINESGDSILKLILHRISNSCEKKAIEILEKVDKKITIKIYEVMKRNQEVFHFSSEFYDKLELLFKEKIKGDECIILNPDIDDLFENNLYKLKINEVTYLVPLWHHELVYDNSGSDIYVKCQPNLPENISIDNKNNLIVNVNYSMSSVWAEKNIEIQLGKRIFNINTDKLMMREHQTFVLEKQGISKINTINTLDISKRGDIVLDITII